MLTNHSGDIDYIYGLYIDYIYRLYMLKWQCIGDNAVTYLQANTDWHWSIYNILYNTLVIVDILYICRRTQIGTGRRCWLHFPTVRSDQTCRVYIYHQVCDHCDALDGGYDDMQMKIHFSDSSVNPDRLLSPNCLAFQHSCSLWSGSCSLHVPKVCFHANINKQQGTKWYCF